MKMTLYKGKFFTLYLISNFDIKIVGLTKEDETIQYKIIEQT
jgi:hypothetical protein